MDANQARQRIVDEAREWVGTPWHHEARVRGAGVDCGMLLLEVYERVGLLPRIDPDHYSMDFMCHRTEEWFTETILKYAEEIFEPPYLPGDVVMFRWGRIFSHGAIVISWPQIIHASSPDRCVTYADVSISPLADRKMRYFRHKELK
jgi:cell wall-associated NlpC family hydrolase